MKFLDCPSVKWFITSISKFSSPATRQKTTLIKPHHHPPLPKISALVSLMISPETMANPATSLPPGFRFHPTDEELILHYLRNRASSAPCPVSIIAEVDIYKFDPWDLPRMWSISSLLLSFLNLCFFLRFLNVSDWFWMDFFFFFVSLIVCV